MSSTVRFVLFCLALIKPIMLYVVEEVFVFLSPLIHANSLIQIRLIVTGDFLLLL
jgi:hypothetical protein